ncbi:MAG: chitobiase/beta-hexosaminidase C-terminal domain-containing protein [Candidatus Moraniibacteriota bacterium]
MSAQSCSPFDVTVTDATPAATIHFTLDSSVPTPSSASVGSGGTIPITKRSTLKVKAFLTGHTESAVVSASYRVDVELTHSIFLKNDGSVWTVGSNANGQLGDGTTMDRANPVQVMSLAGVKEVAAGVGYSVALKDNGTVWTWGINSNGQLGVGKSRQIVSPMQVSNLADVCAISSGASHTLALKSDGSVWGWGLNADGQLGDGTTINRTTPVRVKGASSGIISISAQKSQSHAQKSDGTGIDWGGWRVEPDWAPIIVPKLARRCLAILKCDDRKVISRSDFFTQ